MQKHIQPGQGNVTSGRDKQAGGSQARDSQIRASQPGDVQARDTGGASHGGEPVRVTPPVDIFENEDEILLVAEMPGARPEDLDLRFADSTLTLSCVRRVEQPEGAITAAPDRPLQYYRSFLVPDAVDVTRIAAELKAGILTVHLPKGEGYKTRKIQVRAG